MARYNTTIQSGSITAAATVASPIQGLFTKLTGTAPYTVTLPSPAFYPTGIMQTYYNATSGVITLTTPSGAFRGPTGSGTANQQLESGIIVQITTDGTDYIVMDNQGGALTAASTVTLSPANQTVTISPSGSGTVTISPAGALTINPTTASAINNCSIGASTRSSGAFTTLAFNGNGTFGDANSDTITVNASMANGTAWRTTTTSANTFSLAAYDVDGAAYTNLITLTASNTPTLALTSTGVGTINNMSIGASTRSTGAFTTLDANSTVGLSPANASVTISPSGSGTVTLSPATAGTINNMSIGASTRSTGAFTTLTANAQVTCTQNAASSTTATGSLVVTGGVGVSGQLTAATIVETSSIAFKENVTPIENGLEVILKLMGVSYDRKDGSAKNEIGLIAEQVYNVAPHLVTKDENGKPYGLQYTKISAYLIEAIKTLKEEIDQLKGKK